MMKTKLFTFMTQTLLTYLGMAPLSLNGQLLGIQGEICMTCLMLGGIDLKVYSDICPQWILPSHSVLLFML